MRSVPASKTTDSRVPTRGDGVPPWGQVDGGWRQLHGAFDQQGFSVEWHDFDSAEDLDWSASFRPGCLEICLNLEGNGRVRTGTEAVDFTPLSAGFYVQTHPRLSGLRLGGGRHRFLTVQLSLEFVGRHMAHTTSLLPGLLGPVAERKPLATVAPPGRLTETHETLIRQLRQPPVPREALPLWYQAKALEAASTVLYRAEPPSGGELFCQRYRRQTQERAERVIELLREDLAHTPSLREIGRRVGCSQFHLSRIFAQHTGMSIFQYLRKLRLERAADLPAARAMNVTEVAMEVGYSSPSHFSTAFHARYGCCPGLYPLRTMPALGDATARPQAADRK